MRNDDLFKRSISNSDNRSQKDEDDAVWRLAIGIIIVSMIAIIGVIGVIIWAVIQLVNAHT